MNRKSPVSLLSSDGKLDVQTFHLAPGDGVPEHVHAYPHDLYIASGSLIVTRDGVSAITAGPQTIHFPKGTRHSYEAVLDSVAVSIHPAGGIYE